MGGSSIKAMLGALSILLIIAASAGLVALIARALHANRKHDPIEYYRGWGGYRHPIGLSHKITKVGAGARGEIKSTKITKADGSVIVRE
ncbi:MAG: hypothetical protein WBX25_28390 [Rhodomicrobium sp.]